MDCPDERTWEGRRRIRRYGLPPIHLPHRLGSTLPRTSGTTKAQIRRAEKAIQDMEVQRKRAIQAENSLAALQAQWQNHEMPRTEAGMLEEEFEETHWDKSTQTEDDEHCLPPKKRRTWFEEVSP